MPTVESFVTAPPSADPGAVIGVLCADAGAASSLRYTFAAPRFVERELRAAKMGTVQGVFDETAAAFQFPYYFGENKDAYDECMRDLDEFVGAAGAYVLVVRDAEKLLRGEPDQLAWFTDSMQFYAEYWANVDEPVAFRVVLQTTDEKFAASAPLGATALTV